MKYCTTLSAAFLLSASTATVAGAQVDTTRRISLDSIKVTAERVPTALGGATTAVTRIGRREIERLPQRNFADILRLVPGITIVDRDGLGFDPQPIVRGFYGGGEAEYVLLLVDGKPLTALQSGLVAWDALPPPSAIEAIEVMRGNASSLWGDAAVGAVINVITRTAESTTPALRYGVSAGSYGARKADITLDGKLADRDGSMSVGFDQVEGFRQHSNRSSARLNTRLDVIEGTDGSLTLSTRSHRRRADEPGALLESLAADRDGLDPMFRFDRTNDDAHALQIDGERRLGGSFRMSASAFGETRESSTIRTLALAPGFGDTRERETSGNRVWGTVQFEMLDTPVPWSDRVVLGTDISYGKLRSTWHGMITGPRDSYAQATGARTTLDADGDVTRRTAALFAQYFVYPTNRTQITLGARLDEISDEYVPRPIPGREGEIRSPFLPVFEASQSAFSPKAGFNWRYAERPGFSGSFFLNGSGSFKAPTLDQLFDQRPIPLPEPPYSATTSNALLSPQLGAGVEAGVYQYMTSQSLGTFLLSLSGYETNMRDEIDFDVASLRYVNIARSRHRGFETGVRWSGSLPVSVFVAHTLQSVTSQRGSNAGKQLKAIPSQQLNAGATISALDALQLTAMVSHTGSAYIDDANAQRLPAFTRSDVRLSYTWQFVSLFADVTNIFDTRYNTTAYLDPAGTGQRYLSPAAGRMVMIGIRNGR